jgi:myo-inositol-1(or 4)-monophosphatase
MLNDRLWEQVTQAVLGAAELFADRDKAGQVRHKDRTDFVTAVDLAVQERLRGELAALAPDIQLMGEEKDNSDVDRAGRVWILDPVDGTTNLVHNFRASAVSLALAEGGQVTAGLVYDPFRRELFSARKGQGASLNGEAIHVTAAQTLGQALCSVGTNPGCRDQADQSFRWLRAVYDRCHDVRRMGAASIELCYVAAGRLEAYMERGLKPWDYAAAMLILREAGGTFTDERGEPMGPFTVGAGVGSNGHIHRELLETLWSTEN